jgi:hypothetical protein
VIQDVTVTVDVVNMPTDEAEIRNLFAKGAALRVLSVKVSEPRDDE